MAISIGSAENAYRYASSQNLSSNAPVSGQSITPSQNKRNKHLYRAAFTLATAVAVYAAIKLYNFYQLDQRENVTCNVGENESEMAANFNSYLSEAEKGDAISQYCVANMYKQGKGVEKSLELARHWFKKSGDQGLFVANRDLCRLSTFEDWGPAQGSREKLELENICCPRNCMGICPWDLPREPTIDESDYSTHTSRFF